MNWRTRHDRPEERGLAEILGGQPKTHRTARDGETVHPVFGHHGRARVVLQECEQAQTRVCGSVSIFNLLTSRERDFSKGETHVSDERHRAFLDEVEERSDVTNLGKRSLDNLGRQSELRGSERVDGGLTREVWGFTRDLRKERRGGEESAETRERLKRGHVSFLLWSNSLSSFVCSVLSLPTFAQEGESERGSAFSHFHFFPSLCIPDSLTPEKRWRGERQAVKIAGRTFKFRTKRVLHGRSRLTRCRITSDSLRCWPASPACASRRTGSGREERRKVPGWFFRCRKGAHMRAHGGENKKARGKSERQFSFPRTVCWFSFAPSREFSLLLSVFLLSRSTRASRRRFEGPPSSLSRLELSPSAFEPGRRHRSRAGFEGARCSLAPAQGWWRGVPLALPRASLALPCAIRLAACRLRHRFASPRSLVVLTRRGFALRRPSTRALPSRSFFRPTRGACGPYNAVRYPSRFVSVTRCCRSGS